MPKADAYPPIGDYALVSDSHSAGLVSGDGSVDWGCFHRFDSPWIFGRLLDWERGGFCSLAPIDAEPAGRRYRGNTMILETDQRSGDGLGRTVDCFPMFYRSETAEENPGHPYHQLLRVAETVEGTVEWELVCRPRFEYGIVFPQAVPRGERSALLVGGPGALTVNASVPLEVGEGEVRARFRLGEGERAWFAMTWHLAAEAHPPGAKELDEEDEVREALRCTEEYWEKWVGACRYDGPHWDQVVRSALVLKSLQNAPTGAIVAAATSSLPEHVGGERNWDYRYCWIRDATFTLYAGFILGYRDEARSFLDWLVRTTAGRAEDLQVLYGVGGERLVPEIALPHLEGYRGSSPVRIGNGAARQFQLDLYGEVLDTAHLWRKYGGDIEEEFWGFLRACVRSIEERWREPDDGIWEIRAERRHHVHSKAMCWVGVDRAIKTAEDLDLEAPLERWKALREEIREDVLEHGYDEETGAFVQAYGSKDLDAAVLLLPLVGFIPADDPRMVSTVEAIQERLTRNGLVHRYLTDDGLSGEEGAFVICTFWLVDNLVMLGREKEARELFERVCGLSNDVGLFAEEIDPATGEHLGNFPQAFTHLALINAAINLQRAPEAAEGERPGVEAAEEEREEEPAEGRPAREPGPPAG